jgi:hypothetical protein
LRISVNTGNFSSIGALTVNDGHNGLTSPRYATPMSSNPIFGARIPTDLRERLECHMTEVGQSKSDLLIEALGRYLDVLDGKLVPVGAQSTPPAMDDRFAAMEERMAVLEEMLLEEAAYAPQYVEPQPRYERRLRPVAGGQRR